MVEYLEFTQAPNVEIFEDIMDEAIQKFAGIKIDPSSLFEMEFFMNHRVQEEIHKGNFRTSFFTPANRLARFECITIKQDTKDMNKICVLPRWKYIDMEDESNEPTE